MVWYVLRWDIIYLVHCGWSCHVPTGTQGPGNAKCFQGQITLYLRISSTAVQRAKVIIMIIGGVEGSTFAKRH